MSPPTQIMQADTPKQENGYDCGAYVLGEHINGFKGRDTFTPLTSDAVAVVFAESLCEHLASGRKGTTDLSNITPGYITQFRRRLRDIILQKAELYKSQQQST